MGEITTLLERWAKGDRSAFERLVPIVYEELRGLAEHYLRQERSDHTLQPTAPVHEVYLRLHGIREMPLHNRAHFYGAAAGVMRRVLVDHARRRRAVKRGGPSPHMVPLDAAPEAAVDVGLDLAALDEALTALAQAAPAKARVVELRYFGGLSVDETAQCMNVAPATVHRYWAYARAWLYRRLTASPPEVGGDASS